MAAKNEFLGAVGELVSHSAILEIVNYEKVSGDNFKKENQSNSLVGKAANMLNGLAQKSEKSDKSGSLKTKVSSALGIETRGLKDGVIKVQYNPKSIRFTGSTSSDTSSPVEENGKLVTTITSKGTVKMEVELVFHSKNDLDTSVRDQMNLIMMLLQYGSSREVKFYWANMELQGTLTSFSGKYDMFASTGNPISGRMNLTIQAEDINVKKNYEAIKEERPEKLAKEENET